MENENNFEFRNSESCKMRENVIKFIRQNERNEWEQFKKEKNHSNIKERGG